MSAVTLPLTRGAAAVLCSALLACEACAADTPGTDPRLREVVYDPQAVVTVPVKRGVVTLLLLDPDEAITEVATGQAGDCARAEASWCIAAQAGGRSIFVKPKRSASAANNLSVMTNRRSHAFRLQVLDDHDPKPPVYRLLVQAPPSVRMPSPKPVSTGSALLPVLPAWPTMPPLPAMPSPQARVAERLQSKPQVRNTAYAIAQGDGSDDIVPTLVFDDGRFTYLKFPGNREVPAIFHVLPDGSETVVNARMEDDLLVVDRVSRRLMLRAGAAVVGLWNEAFDLDGQQPGQGTTVPGVQRVLRPSAQATVTGVSSEVSHD